MSRMNNKGFLLAESLIVSTFVLTVLIFLFVQFKNIMVNHKKSYTYNSVENIYDLGSMADYFKNNEKSNNALNVTLSAVGTSSNLKIYDKNSGCLESVLKDGSKGTCDILGQKAKIEYILYTDSDIDNIDLSKIEYQEMRDFIDKIDATKIQNKGRLFAKFTNGNFATIAMEQKTDIIVPNRIVTYELGSGNNINWWSKLYPSAFTEISYDETSKMNTIKVSTTIEQWEQLYLPLETNAGQTYTLQFDYELVTEMPKLDDQHPGIAYQILAENKDDKTLGTELTNTDHQNETDLKITSDTLPEEAEEKGTKTISFTAKPETSLSYLVFNFGYMQNEKTGTIKLGNIRLTENVTGRTMYGPMLSPKFGQMDDTYSDIQPVVNPHNFKGWFDEVHKDQSDSPIQIKQTTAISPSLFTNDRETVVAHFE